MNRQTRISAFADRAIEAGWLLALVFAPYFFNLLTARHFEPDKATVVRALALIILAAWGIKTIERMTLLGERIRWNAWWRAPLAVPALVFGGVFLFTTVLSISPYISWWGSYNRLQGTYTNLSYMAIFAALVGNLRTRDQLRRLITTTILTGFSVAVYGLFQHYGHDPLPWKGDVLTRISSTMGNSIFVAAYLIMVVPFVLSRIVTSIATLRQPREGATTTDLVWGAAMLLLLFGQQAFLVGLLKFGTAVRVSDFRYWWVFPAGLFVVTATFILTSRQQTQTSSRILSSFAGGLLACWAICLIMVYAASQGVQQLDPNPLVSNWALWTAAGVVAIAAFIAATFILPRRQKDATPTFAFLEMIGYIIVLLVLLIAVFYSQSRGPQIGLLAGLAIYVNIMLIRLERNAAISALPLQRVLRRLLVAAIAIEVAAAAFLIVFNTSQAPMFERLRNVQYVGRLGRLLETESGTGRVRTLIWFGDQHGGGAVGLITSNPLRMVIGYGPETMFTVYNPFYPTDLAHYEARGASPDRSHQAELDELVTKGILGLLSYFFLFISAILLAWRLIRRSMDLEFQALYVACLAAIIAHLFEGLTGIPIVSTLTMLWVAFGLLVAGGIIDGQLSLTNMVTVPAGEETTEQAATAVVPPTRGGEPSSAEGRTSQGSGSRSSRNRSGTQRSGTQRQTSRASTSRSTPTPGVGSFRWTYLLIGAAALFGVWYWNLRVDYADMWYNQASSFQPRDSNEEVFKYSRILNAVVNAPKEDYYYLQLGNSLIQLAYGYKARNPQTQADLAPVRPNQNLEDLFSGGTIEQQALNTWQNNSAEQLLEYARLVLERARELNPGNKDHSANLARLQALWYSLHNDPAHLEAALQWYDEAHRIAPNDVVIINEWATTLASGGPSRYGEVEAKLKESLALDADYADTYIKLGNLYRITDRFDLAVDQYAQAIKIRANSLEDGREGSLDPAIAGLRSHPDALKRLLAAYQEAATKDPSQAGLQSAIGRIGAALGDQAIVRTSFDRAITLAPQDITYRQQYTLALSETQQYDLALQQAQAGLQIAQTQQSKPNIDSFTQLMQRIQERKASGGS